MIMSDHANLLTADIVTEYESVQKINLKNPLLAGLLAWLVPGLGHYYQGRFPKAFLFFLCITSMFLVGCYYGSSADVGVARNVYYSWRSQDRRLYFIPQACMGIAAIPAGFQAMQTNAGKAPFGSFMAPPQIEPDDRTGVPPTLTVIMQKLHFYFELGTCLTVIAGLLNLLAVFDAIDGPLVYPPDSSKKKKGKEESNDKKQ